MMQVLGEIEVNEVTGGAFVDLGPISVRVINSVINYVLQNGGSPGGYAPYNAMGDFPM